MSMGIVQITGEQLSRKEVKEICERLANHRIQLLSLRGCRMKNSCYTHLMQSLGGCKSIVQLNLNIGVVRTLSRVHSLSHVLTQNRSLTSLLLHGCSLGYEGAALLAQGLALHPNIVSLDLGDCCMTDSALMGISDLLPPNGAKRGLQDLTLSGNAGVTAHGWSKFFIALAAGSELQTLHIDYNNIMDYGTGCLAVALAASKTLKFVDLESCGLTELGGQVLLHLVRNFPISCLRITLSGNNITPSTLSAIRSVLNSSETETSSSSGSDANDHGTPTEDLCHHGTAFNL
uniref:Uncharacterized protein n=1 Tax=Capitella teleta TaxID=283909 RepID=X2A7U4_CAPTE